MLTETLPAIDKLQVSVTALADLQQKLADAASAAAQADIRRTQWTLAGVGLLTEASDVFAQISTAAAEQTKGISQVNDAVTQLDQVTQQNAALVEESAAASDSLRQQAAQLVDAVRVFRLQAA